MNSFIVRADHYPDGLIIPLGFTDQKGKTVYIDRVIDIERENSRRIVYCCRAKGKTINLIYQDLRWIVKQ